MSRTLPGFLPWFPSGHLGKVSSSSSLSPFKKKKKKSELFCRIYLYLCATFVLAATKKNSNVGKVLPQKVRSVLNFLVSSQTIKLRQPRPLPRPPVPPPSNMLSSIVSDGIYSAHSSLFFSVLPYVCPLTLHQQRRLGQGCHILGDG